MARCRTTPIHKVRVCRHIPRVNRAGRLCSAWLKMPAWKVGYRGIVPRSGIQVFFF